MMSKWKIIVEEPKGQGEFIAYEVDGEQILYDTDDNATVQDKLNDLQANDPDGRCFGASYAGE